MVTANQCDNVAPRVNLLDFDRQALEVWFLALGEKRFRAQQILKWIYQLNTDDFERLSTFSRSLQIGRAHV